MIYKSKEATQIVYDDDPDKCLGIINKYWLLKSRPSLSKILDKLHRIDFKEQFDDLVTLLNRIVGAPRASQFEYWMI